MYKIFKMADSLIESVTVNSKWTNLMPSSAYWPGDFSYSADFSSKILSGKPSVSNSLDPDQAQHCVVLGPDMGPNCLQKLSADSTSSSILH